MSNVLVAVVTLIIGFFLASYGAYTGYYAVSRSQTVMRVSSSFERQLDYIYAIRDDLGRVPGISDIPMNRITTENRFGLKYSYRNVGDEGHLCVESDARDYVVEALKNVAKRYNQSLLGNACGSSGAPTAATVALTVRIK